MKNLNNNLKILHIGGGQENLPSSIQRGGKLLFSNFSTLNRNGGGRQLISAISCGGVVL